MNLEQARINMVEQQIRPWGVTNSVVLDLFKRIPREQFVTEEYKNLAYADMNIPIGEGQIMLTPKVQARMLDALNVQPHEAVLEIGTGSGFVTAVLAKQARIVHTVDINQSLSRQAEANLQALELKNINFYVADAAQGFDAVGKVDAIIITGALPCLPDALTSILLTHGRIVAIVGEGAMMEVVLATLQSNGRLWESSLFDTYAPMLKNALQPQCFEF